MRAWLCVLWFVSGLLPAMAAEEFAASFRLRGGYDSNPLLVPNGKGSALAAWEAAAVYGHDNGEWVTGATGEAALTRYREREFEPIQNYRLRLRREIRTSSRSCWIPACFVWSRSIRSTA